MMDLPALKLDETNERDRLHREAIRLSLVLVPEGTLCFWDAQGITDKRSGIFEEPLITTCTLEIYHKEKLPHPVGSLLDAVAVLHRSIQHADCPIPPYVMAQVQRAKLDLAKELVRLRVQFATQADGHFIESEIDSTGLLLRHTHATRDRYNPSKRKIAVNLTAAIGPILYWVQQNQTALNEYLQTGIMPSDAKQTQYRLNSFKIHLFVLSNLIKKGLLKHGVELEQVSPTDTTLTFKRKDVMCEGRSRHTFIQCMIDEWLQGLTRIVELEPDFLPQEWQEPFLISRGKVVHSKSQPVGYRDLAMPDPIEPKVDYYTTSFYGVHILRWVLSHQDKPLSRPQLAEPHVQPIGESKPTRGRELLSWLLK